jgi:uncharacterized protein
MPTITITWLCIGLLGLLPFALGFWVSINRGRAAKNYGFPAEDPTHPLHKASRAHGNAIEYVPTLMILAVVLDRMMPGQVTMWLVLLATLGRYLHAAGMLTCRSLDDRHPLRVAGSVLTYFPGLIMALIVIWRALA